MRQFKLLTPLLILLGLSMVGSIMWAQPSLAQPQKRILGKKTDLPKDGEYKWICYSLEKVHYYYPCPNNSDATHCNLSIYALPEPNYNYDRFVSRKGIPPSRYKKWEQEWKKFAKGRVCILGEVLRDETSAFRYYLFERMQNDRQCLSLDPTSCP